MTTTMFGDPAVGNTTMFGDAPIQPEQPVSAPGDNVAPEQGHFGDAMGQGMFGLADEAAGVIGASLGTFDPNMPDSTWSERYRGMRDSAKDNANAYAEREPGMAMTGELAGGVLAPGGIAMKAMDKVNKMGGAASTLGKVRKAGALSLGGAAEGAAYGAGSADPGERLEGATQGATAGAIATPLMAGAGNMVMNKLAKNKATKDFISEAPSRDELKSQARAMYDQLDNMSITMSQPATEEIANHVMSKAAKFGFHPKIHPKVAAALEEVERISKNPTSLKELDTARRIMGQAAQSNEPAEKALASSLIEIIDNRMEKLGAGDLVSGAADADVAKDMYRTTRNLWSRNRKAEILEEAIDKADIQASGTDLGLRNQFRAIMNNKKKRNAFSKDEQELMKKVIKGSKIGLLSRFFGNLGIGQGASSSSLMGMLGAGAGGAFGGPIGMAAVPAFGQAAKMNAARLTSNKANLAEAAVRAGRMPPVDGGRAPNSLFDAASIYAPQALLND